MSTINDRIGIVLERSNKTKTAFAKSLKVSQQYISKLIKTGNPSDLLIEDICQRYGINETWLRTGKGNIESDINKEHQLIKWAENVLKDENDSFQRRFVNMLMELDDSDWETLEKIALKLHKEKLKPTTEDLEAGYKKSSSNSVRKTVSPALNITNGTDTPNTKGKDKAI